MRRKWEVKKHSVFPPPFLSTDRPLSHPKPTLEASWGSYTRSPLPSHHSAYLLDISQEKDSKLFAGWFQGQIFFLIPLLLLTSQNLQIAAGILSRFYSCIQCKIWGGLYLPIWPRSHGKFFTSVFLLTW